MRNRTYRAENASVCATKAFCVGNLRPIFLKITLAAMDRVDPEYGFGLLDRLDIEIDGDGLAI